MIEPVRLPNLTDDENATVAELLARLERRKPRNLLRASYYDGKHAIRQVGSVIPPQYYQLGLVLGWSAKAVDILARRCNLERFVWADGDLDSVGGREVWDQNALASEIDQALVSSLIHGVAFAITTEGQEGEPAALIHFKDALHASGIWDPRRRALSAAMSVMKWDESGRPVEYTAFLDGSAVSVWRENNRWKTDRQEVDGVPVEPLVYRPRLGRPLGASRISRTVMSLHDSALREVIRLEGHMDIYSYPELWLLGADGAVFKNADGSPKAEWQVLLGRFKGIPDDDAAENPRADVKQFPASSPAPHLEMLKQQAMLFSGETSIPLTSLGVSDMSNPTSADSYLASREDLIAEAEGATDTWAPALQRSFRRALSILNDGEDDPSWSTIEPQWRSPVHLSRAAAADAGAKQLAAVPWLADTEVGLSLIGLTPQQAQLALGERRRVQGRQILERLTAVPTEAQSDGPGQPG